MPVAKRRGGIDEDEPPARRRGQLAETGAQTVVAVHLRRGLRGELRRQGGVFGGVQFVQFEPVLGPGEGQGQERGAGIDRERARLRLEGAYDLHEARRRRGQVGAADEAGDARLVLGLLPGTLAPEIVEPGPCVGVHVAPALRLAAQMVQQMHEHDVLEHVGVVAGVEAVEITEHALPGRRPAPPAQTMVEPPSTTQF